MSRIAAASPPFAQAFTVLALQTALEQARFRGPLATACAAAWARIAQRTVVRHLELPRRMRVIAIGGATLGGSGKTPLAIACAAELAPSATPWRQLPTAAASPGIA